MQRKLKKYSKLAKFINFFLFFCRYMSQDLSSTDLLWSNFENSFVKVFPSGKLPEEYLKDD